MILVVSYFNMSTCCQLTTESWDAAKRSFKLVWRCHQLLSGFLANDYLSECHDSHVCQLMIRLIMR
jgi:hypothetical protein